MENDIPARLRATWQVPSFEIAFWSGAGHDACVVIPVINEGTRIRQLAQRLHDLGTHRIADILIVDGGSADGSLVVSELRAAGIAGLLVKNGPCKLSAQLRCGYGFVLEQGYTSIVTMDGNGKDDPAFIPGFLEALVNGTDFAQASRYIPGGAGENTPKLRDFAIRCVHAPLLAQCSGFPWTDTTQGFRGYSRRLLLDPRVAPFRNVFCTYELLAYLSYCAPRLGYQCREIPVTRRYPPSGAIPTKISSLSGNLHVLGILAKACLGKYGPVAG
jgi:glycosyltransferase involved in cell wall biosynthesis